MSEWATSVTALMTAVVLLPSDSVRRRRTWMSSMVFLQLMKRSKFSFTCAGRRSPPESHPGVQRVRPSNQMAQHQASSQCNDKGWASPALSRDIARGDSCQGDCAQLTPAGAHQGLELPSALRKILLQVQSPYPEVVYRCVLCSSPRARLFKHATLVLRYTEREAQRRCTGSTGKPKFSPHECSPGRHLGRNFHCLAAPAAQ